MRALPVTLDPEAALDALRRPGQPAVLFDGRGGHDGSWPGLVAIEPAVALRFARVVEDETKALAPLDALIAKRRGAGGPGGTGVAVLCAYEAWTPASRPLEAPWDVCALSVDASVVFAPRGEPVLAGPAHAVEIALRALDRAPAPERLEAERVRGGRPSTSLPRDAYKRAVDRVKRHIVAGDLYQANLTQRIEAPFADDPWDLYRALARATPAPRSAFIEMPDLALASVSPEVFVDVEASGRAETRPIKGTRAREAAPDDDAAAAAELYASEKDRAELVMIVDVLRNDLGRIALIGSVRVPEPCTLRSYPAVHHLVARVTAELGPMISPSTLLAAVLPGGSITGAPKRRAIERLFTIEPCPRGLYTGTLFWFDDDGSVRSSILIRSAIVAEGRVSIGAGGGIVADSEADAEWSESNAKARALTRVLGFDPEEAT